MPSYLDLGLIAVVLISALLSMLRGFTREVLAIASWAAAAFAAYTFYPLLLPFAQQHIAKQQIAIAASAGAIFFVTLIIVSIITVKLSDIILDSKIGPLDRSLGFIFGAGRGYLLCVIAFVFFAWLVPEKAHPAWVQNSKTKGWLVQTGDSIQAMLPENLDADLSKLLKKNKGGANDLPPSEDPDSKAVPPENVPAPPTRPGRKTELQSPGQTPVQTAAQPSTRTVQTASTDRKGLDALVSRTSPAPSAGAR